MQTNQYSDPLFDGRCEVCRNNEHSRWILVEPFIWNHPRTDAQIERRGIAVCDDCSCKDGVRR